MDGIHKESTVKYINNFISAATLFWLPAGGTGLAVTKQALTMTKFGAGLVGEMKKGGPEFILLQSGDGRIFPIPGN